MFPKARADQLTIRQLPDELLVFDHQRMKAHCLNRTAALVWQHCDGKTSPEQLAALVERELPVADALPIVQLALHQLGRRHLLEQVVSLLSERERESRRDALKKMAIAAVALPLIMSLAAPKAQASNSILQGTNCQNQPDGTACLTPGLSGVKPRQLGICCGGNCLVGATSCPGGTAAAKTPPCLPDGATCTIGGTPCCNGPCTRAGDFICGSTF